MIRCLILALLLLGLASCVYNKENRRTSMNAGQAALKAGKGMEMLKSAVTLGQGDVFEVRVFQEKDLTSIYRVSADGTINFPLIGKVSVDGKTPEMVEVDIRDRLAKDYLQSPYVSVFVKEFNSKKVFVFGEVNKPGTFQYEDGMSIIQAITLAGGMKKTANRNSVGVTRLVKGQEKRIVNDIEEIWKGKAANFLLKPGDIIFVPEALF